MGMEANNPLFLSPFVYQNQGFPKYRAALTMPVSLARAETCSYPPV